MEAAAVTTAAAMTTTAATAMTTTAAWSGACASNCGECQHGRDRNDATPND